MSAPSPAVPVPWSRLGRWQGLLLPAAILLVWEFLARSGAVDPRFLPLLEAVAGRLVTEVAHEGLFSQLGSSLQRDLLGFAIGSAVGIAVGLAIGFSRTLERMLSPILLVHRQIALFAWVPLLSMWFGGGEAGKIAFIALAAFQPTLINTWRGIAGIPASYRELADALLFKRLDFVWLIAVPGALPQIFTGIHAALIYAWLATIGAELLLNVAPGIAGRMNEGQRLFQMDLLLLCVLVLGAIGVMFNLGTGTLERRLARWRIA
jgi:sulfonate transport system permease protein